MFGRRTTDGTPRPAIGSAPGGLRVLPEELAVAQPAKPDAAWLDTARRQIAPAVDAALDGDAVRALSRAELEEKVGAIVDDILDQEPTGAEGEDRNALVLSLTEELLARHCRGSGDKEKKEKYVQNPIPQAGPEPASPRRNGRNGSGGRSRIQETKDKVQPLLLERIDIGAASKLPREELGRELAEIVAEILAEQKIQLNRQEQRELVSRLLNDMLGLGPLEPLLADDSITDIMVNGHDQVFVERNGKLELTDVTFRDNAQVMNIANRIVSQVGRRIDESNPICDARLADGSRVNLIIPPLAIDGPTISIRKFAKKGITLDVMERQGNLSRQMATVLKIAARSALNILISGGTGSGKTTLLNALSQMIDNNERIVTIEDAAELQLQQPHVVRLETRPPNVEGHGEVTMRDLVKNALRMRPDRIIVGEVRGAEAVDMLQAMNTGHEGSLGTIHANRPREALTRLENMVGMAGINLPSKAVRTQIASAIDMIVQVSRMRDGIRRVTHIMEVVGMEGDVITTQELFRFEYKGESADGRLIGEFKSTGLRPHFTPKAEYYGLDRALLEAM